MATKKAAKKVAKKMVKKHKGTQDKGKPMAKKMRFQKAEGNES